LVRLIKFYQKNITEIQSHDGLPDFITNQQHKKKPEVQNIEDEIIIISNNDEGMKKV